MTVFAPQILARSRRPAAAGFTYNPGNLIVNPEDWSGSPYDSVAGLAPTMTAGITDVPLSGITTSTRLTWVSQFQNRIQSVTMTNGVGYTISFYAKNETGNTSISFYDAGLTFPAVVLTAGWVLYSFNRTGTGAAADWGLQERNGAGFGAMLVTAFQIYPT